MSVTAYDGSFSFRQKELATRGFQGGGMSTEGKKLLAASPLMMKAQEQEQRTWTMTCDRDKKRKETDPSFEPSDEDWQKPKAFDYDRLINYYKVLGIDEYASQAEVKKAYKELSLIYHPDKSANLSREEQEEHALIFIELKNAYLTLGDNATRRQYDKDRDNNISGAEVNGYKQKKDKASFDAAAVLKKLQEMQKPDGKIIDVEVHCKIEKFFYGGSKSLTRRRKMRNKEGDEWEEHRTFRIDLPKGAQEGWSIILKGGDMHADTQADRLNFQVTSKPHAVVERKRDDIEIKKTSTLKPDIHIQPYLTMEVDTVAGRTLYFWGRNPFYSSGCSRGQVAVSVLGEAIGTSGKLHFAARFGTGSGDAGKHVCVSVTTHDTKLEFYCSVDANGTVEDLKISIADLLDLTESKTLRLLKVVEARKTVAFYNDALPIGDTRAVVVELRKRLYEFPMSLRQARELVGLVTAQVDTKKFRDGLRSCQEVQDTMKCSRLLDEHYMNLTSLAPHYGYRNDRKGLWIAVQRALWITKDEGDAALLQQRLADFGFSPKEPPKQKIAKRRKKQRPPVETFLFRNGLGPTRWTTEHHLPDPGSETDTADEGEETRSSTVEDREVALLGLGNSSSSTSSGQRVAHGTFGAALHPQMVKRSERLAELTPKCTLELAPIYGHGEYLQLYTRPTCYLYFYSNLRQSFAQRQGQIAPQPIFAVAISCPSGAKRKGREDWSKLKTRLLPLLRQTVFKMFSDGRDLLPRPLSVQSAFADCYRTDEGIFVIQPGKDEWLEDDGDDEDNLHVSMDEMYAMLDREGKERIDLDDLDSLDEVERLTLLIREDRKKNRGGQSAVKQFWQRDARLEAKRSLYFKAAAEAQTSEDIQDRTDISPEDVAKREAEAWRRMGRKAFQNTDFFLAQLYYSNEMECLRCLPESSANEAIGTALSNRSACFVQVRDFDAALQDAKQATEKRPTWSKAWTRIGLAASSLGSAGFEEAVGAWTKAVELEPNAANLEGLTVAIKSNRGRIETANDDKEKGNQATRLQEWGTAVACYTAGLAKLPPPPKKVPGKKKVEDDHAILRAILYANRSLALVRLKHWQAACDDADEAIEAKEDYAQGYCRRGVAQLGLGLPEDAYQSFAMALKLDERLQNARKGREVCLGAIPFWESPAAIRRQKRFLRDSYRSAESQRIFCITDVHYDHHGNEEWLHSISSTKFLDDILIVAGNVADATRPLLKGLTALRAKFRRVFYVPGNHEMWIHPSEKSRLPDSFSKLWSILKACDDLDIDTVPAAVGNGLFIVPLLSWYCATFDTKDPFPDPKLDENKHCKWPIDAEQQVWRYMLALNRAHLSKPYHGTVISFSHFAPRTCCPVWKNKGLEKISGCLELDEQVRDVHSKVHVYGHTHYRHKVTEEGVTYLHQHLGFEQEHLSNEAIMCIWNGRTTVTEMTSI